METLKNCPFCGAQPDPPYTNNVGETYARIRHDETCTFAFGHPREQWLNGLAFERWNTRATVPAEGVAHLCETGRYRPYPRTLCSSCRSSSTGVDVTDGDLSVRGLCAALNRVVARAAEICAEMAREAATQAAKYDAP